MTAENKKYAFLMQMDLGLLVLLLSLSRCDAGQSENVEERCPLRVGRDQARTAVYIVENF
jgi:hypothetical protein